MGYHDDDDHRDRLRRFWSRDDSHDLSGRILLAAVVCLSVVIFFVVALHLYARCVLQRRARRRVAFRILGLMASGQPQPPPPPPKTGLDPSVIASLPTFVVTARDRPDGEEATSFAECAVCLSALEDQVTARLLPNCNHAFHVECIDTWLALYSTCPLCRTHVEPARKIDPEPREAPARPRDGASPSAPPLEGILCEGSPSSSSSEADNGGGLSTQPASCGKTNGSSSSWRLNSFRRMLSRDRSSSRRINPSCGGDDCGCDGDHHGVEALERQTIQYP